MRKDIVDLKRTMNDEIHEKEATQKAAIDLRNMVKKAEAEKIELNRSLLDAGQKIAGEWCRVEHQGTDLEGGGSSLGQCGLLINSTQQCFI